VAVLVPGLERHPGIHRGGIAAEHGLHRALPLDERVPVHPRDAAQAGDAVRHRELGERDPLVGPRRRFLGLHALVGDPVLEPEERRLRAAAGPELREQPRDEGRGERRRIAHELVQCRGGLGDALARGIHQQRRPLVGALQLLQPPHRPERHAPHALDQAQPEHGGNGPQLSDRERPHLLEGAQEEVHALELDPRLGVRDQRDRDLVHPRVARERATGQLGQLAVVAAGQAAAHFPDVLFDDVEVVQEPLAGRPDVQLAVGGNREARPDVGQDRTGLAESIEEPGAPAWPATKGHPLRGREGASPLSQVFGAKEVAAERTGEKLVRALGRTAEQTLECRRYDHTGLGEGGEYVGVK